MCQTFCVTLIDSFAQSTQMQKKTIAGQNATWKVHVQVGYCLNRREALQWPK